MKFMTVRVRFTEFVKDSEDLENSNLFVFVHIKFEMFEFVWEGKIWRMTPLVGVLLLRFGHIIPSTCVD